MRKSLQGWIVLGAVALVLGAPALAGSNWPSEVVMDEKFDVSAGGTLRVTLPDADLDVRTGAGNQLRIEITIAGEDLPRVRDLYAGMDVRAAADAGGVSLEGKNADSGWSWRSSGGYSIRARIEMPEDFNVDLRTSDGDIRLDRVRGDVLLKTSDGDVEVTAADGNEVTIATSDGDVEIGELAASRVEIRSSDGDIAVDAIDAREIEVRTSDGDIAVAGVSGEIRATTSDGDISLTLVDFAGTTLKTGDGDISVRADASLQAELELSGEEVSLSGSWSFGGSVSGKSARGPVNGGGPVLLATARDGSVRLSVN